MKPLVVTPGEPAGIGPDLLVQLAHARLTARVVAVTDPALLERRARDLALPLGIQGFEDDAPAPEPGALEVLPLALPRPVVPGRPDPGNAPAVVEMLRVAAAGCLAGRFAALVTGPIQRSVINDAGIPFPGHTEFLAELAGVSQPVMMLAAPGLRVALVTTHVPLHAVCREVTRERVEAVLRVLAADLQRQLGIHHPRILVCGLNPHAGEEGRVGREEVEVIAPVVRALQAQGLALAGPLPADTAFTPPRLREADAVLAMYHDQGLPVLKHMGFGRSVNITLGLPFVRTSVDHGTALDLAGSGRADPGSLRVAIETAVDIAQRMGRL
ncbi:MAG: 4-hydroxythreonine-4-phosphate dehydrogenase PdxA [Gammaproteobacteria bacterium]|nr:4-hydroxythreonine-4-phosphate dehydrogenase PdxA [Gammaproteobacteria bacterium]